MIAIHDLSHSYGSGAPVLHHLSLEVANGRHLAIIGPNGSGKSTLAQIMAARLRPTVGRVTIDGIDVNGSIPGALRARLVGLAPQDPQDAMVASEVRAEVEFGPRCQGLDPAEVRRRGREALEACGLGREVGRSTDTLSGGEQARLVLAGLLAQGVGHLILDEVDASLDPGAADAMAMVIRGLVDGGATVVSITHRSSTLLMADEVVVLDGGRILWRGTPEHLLGERSLVPLVPMGHDPLMALAQQAAHRGLWPSHPDPSRWTEVLDGLEKATTPGTVPRVRTDAVTAHGGGSVTDAAVPATATAGAVAATSPVPGLVLKDVVGSKEGPRLSVAELHCPPGTLTVVCGRSGSGKTTLLRTMAGTLRPRRGQVTLDGEPVRPGMVGLVVQRPQDQLFCPTVLEDVALGPEREFPRVEACSRAEEALERLGVSRDLWYRSPFSLSGGQARRVAVASVVACGSQALLMDEPCSSLDGRGAEEMVGLVDDLVAEGRSVVITTHDLVPWVALADQVVVMGEGRILWKGPWEELRRDPRPLLWGRDVPALETRALVRGGGWDPWD